MLSPMTAEPGLGSRKGGLEERDGKDPSPGGRRGQELERRTSYGDEEPGGPGTNPQLCLSHHCSLSLSAPLQTGSELTATAPFGACENSTRGRCLPSAGLRGTVTITTALAVVVVTRDCWWFQPEHPVG